MLQPSGYSCLHAQPCHVLQATWRLAGWQNMFQPIMQLSSGHFGSCVLTLKPRATWRNGHLVPSFAAEISEPGTASSWLSLHRHLLAVSDKARKYVLHERMNVKWSETRVKYSFLSGIPREIGGGVRSSAVLGEGGVSNPGREKGDPFSLHKGASQDSGHGNVCVWW